MIRIGIGRYPDLIELRIPRMPSRICMGIVAPGHSCAWYEESTGVKAAIRDFGEWMFTAIC